MNDTTKFPEITTAVLTSQNEEGGETNISTGWHTIEFFMWGQDQTKGGPGNRPVTDYTTGKNAARRAAFYLRDRDAAARRRPRHRPRPVGPRDRRVPQDVPRRPEGVARRRAARDRRADAGQLAGERIAVTLDQGPGRRALLLQ